MTNDQPCQVPMKGLKNDLNPMVLIFFENGIRPAELGSLVKFRVFRRRRASSPTRRGPRFSDREGDAAALIVVSAVLGLGSSVQCRRAVRLAASRTGAFSNAVLIFAFEIQAA